MILNVEGNINRYYVETLCLVFFPGSTFGDSETVGVDVPEVTVKVKDTSDGKTASVTIRLNDKVCEAVATVPNDEQIVISTAESIAVGRALFSAGKELLGHTPPWGILTGVRPAKIAGGLLKNGKGILKTKKILRDEYFLHPQKAALATAVAAADGIFTELINFRFNAVGFQSLCYFRKRGVRTALFVMAAVDK